MSLVVAEGPDDRRALVAIDLGAESCRVSLLRWPQGDHSGGPEIRLVHRFANNPRMLAGGLHWDFAAIEAGLHDGLRQAAAFAPEGIRSIAVDGWAVDYLRLPPSADTVVGDPFCYRDERTISAEAALHTRITPERLRALTGVQLSRINTLYQLYADTLAHPEQAQAPWLNLPEAILYRLGGRAVGERTMATHSQMTGTAGEWCEEIFAAAGLSPAARPELVAPGTILGKLRGPLAALPAFAETTLIAPACHDTASAIAGIPAEGDDWAYLSSGTWSLVGALLAGPENGAKARAENYTNLAAAGGLTCFHKNVNGMWLLRQCLEQWSAEGSVWELPALIAAAEAQPAPAARLVVDDPELLLTGQMPARINAQLTRRGLAPLDGSAQAAPAMANLIFHSLAARYAAVLADIAEITGRRFTRLFVVGGGSQNVYLNRLTAEATGLEVVRGSAESSTLGNFAVQLATFEQEAPAAGGIAQWATVLAQASA